ncbi:hypothetical protein WJX74_004655 [Apatococcus lobatus]|uniref:Uncharacterized protein n=1 Tax=Apatococcus lobatus TaxID=904363 RepID=A0AAW1QDH5_9CHLO
MLLGWSSPQFCWDQQHRSSNLRFPSVCDRLLQPNCPHIFQPVPKALPTPCNSGRLQLKASAAAEDSYASDGAAGTEDAKPHIELGVLDPRFGGQLA